MTGASFEFAPERPVQNVQRRRISDQGVVDEWDQVATEEPLEIRIVFGPPEGRRSKSLSITMRTPGHDFELATGFLLTEGIIGTADQILSSQAVGPPPEGGVRGNTLLVELQPDVEFRPEDLQRNFYLTSSCGICGKASLEAVKAQGCRALPHRFEVADAILRQLPNQLREQQEVFDSTGGLHAAGLFDPSGQLLELREDVGRHNAVDKLIGWMVGRPQSEIAQNPILTVSGRASFELVQKAVMAQIPMLVAVGAPSSLAVQLAEEFDLTLVGFASAKRINIYSGFERVRFPESAS